MDDLGLPLGAHCSRTSSDELLALFSPRREVKETLLGARHLRLPTKQNSSHLLELFLGLDARYLFFLPLLDPS